MSQELLFNLVTLIGRAALDGLELHRQQKITSEQLIDINNLVKLANDQYQQESNALEAAINERKAKRSIEQIEREGGEVTATS